MYIYYYIYTLGMHAESLQLCPNLCNPIDCNLLGFSVHGISPNKNTGVGYHGLLPGPEIKPVPHVFCTGRWACSH